MLLGARQECIAGGADIQEKMAILKGFGYDFLELSLSRAEIANLGPQSADMYKAAVEQSGLAIRSTSLGHFGGCAGRYSPAYSRLCGFYGGDWRGYCSACDP